MLRGQAELISTVIIVGVAVALALGVVYYLTPLLAQNRAYSQLQAMLSSISASLSTGLIYQSFDNNTGNLTVIFSVAHAGGEAPSVGVYAAVIIVDDAGVPVGAVNTSYYKLNSSVAPVDAKEGWLDLDAYGRFVYAEPSEIRVFVRDGYYPLGSFEGLSGVSSVKLAYLGIIGPGNVTVCKTVVEGAEAGKQYIVSLFVLADGVFYEVARVPLEPLS